MTKPTYEALQAALESLERGDAREAFGAFRWTSTAVYTALAPNRFKDFWRD